MVSDNEPNGVEYYPLDYDALRKGDVISPETIEAAVNCKRMHPQYPLRLLGFREQVERELMRRGYVVTIKSEGDCLRILTDEEASEYNAKATEAYWRRAARAHARNLAVDAGQLTDERKKQHERTLVVNGRLLQAMRNERKSINLECHERKTPGLMEPTQ